MSHVSDHPDNRLPWRIGLTRAKVLANWVTPWKIVFCEGSIDDCHRRATREVIIGKGAAFDNRSVHGREIARRGAENFDQLILLICIAVYPKDREVLVITKGKVVYRTNRFDAGNGCQPVEQILEEVAALLRCAIARIELDVHTHCRLREAGIDGRDLCVASQ